VLHGVQIPHLKGEFWWIGAPIVNCKNGLTDRFAVWVVDSSELKDAHIQCYSPGGANVPSLEDTLPPPSEND